jgi:Iap family predicted aminopeptidase
MPASRSSDPGLWADFLALCDCGGRRAGTESEGRALGLLRGKLQAIGGEVRSRRVSYAGWHLRSSSLVLADGTRLACHPLLGTQSGTVEAEVCDVGRGTQADFARSPLEGRIALVRHEYPFSDSHIHRRRKLAWATEAGAAGFLIANPQPGAGPVAGSSGRAGGPGIPAAGIAFETAELVCRAGRATLSISGQDHEAHTEVLALDLPGRGPGWVVLSAHLDGHDLAESALDNASGVAAALAVARSCARDMARSKRGLRVCLFSAEEWALAGSKHYLDTMDAGERGSMLVNINLDTVAGDRELIALTSEFPELEALVAEAGIRAYAPMMPNSDHYNFARHGIPALRLVAGFNRPESNVRHILTGGDTRDKATEGELRQAAATAERLVRRSLEAF